jgi:membrane protein DedA with SNARE-associated domain
MTDLNQLLAQYSHLLVFGSVMLDQLGVPVPAAGVLLLAGAAAGSGELDPALLMGVAVAGSLAADLLWYSVGRRKGTAVLGLLCRVSGQPGSCLESTEAAFERMGAGALLVAKFVPGLQTAAPPLAGTFRMPVLRFVAFSLGAALLWCATFLALGALFHDEVQRASSLATRFGGWILFGSASAAAVFIALRRTPRWRCSAATCGS